MPPKVLKRAEAARGVRDLDAVLAVAGDDVAERDDAADLGVRDEPSIRMPSSALATMAALFAPMPTKLARIVTLSESVTWMPLPPLPLTTL